MNQPHKPTVLISYSSRHYSPGVIQEREWTSAGQIAKHLMVCHADLDPAYQDHPPLTPPRQVDLLITPYPERWANLGTRHCVFFPAISHPAYTNKLITEDAIRFGEPTPEFIASPSALRQFDQNITSSDILLLIGNETVRNSYLENGATAEKIVLLHCGIDTAHFTPRPRDPASPPVFIHNVTQFCLRKGTHYVLDSWQEVRRRCPTAELWLLGKKGKEHAWEGKIAQPGIHFLGEYLAGSDHYRSLLNKGHFVVAPALSEGQAGGVLEAMSCGCVPVAFANSGIDPLIYGGFEPRFRSTESLTDAMLNAIALMPEWPRHSPFTREQVLARHTWEAFMRTVRNVSNKLLVPNT